MILAVSNNFKQNTFPQLWIYFTFSSGVQKDSVKKVKVDWTNFPSIIQLRQWGFFSSHLSRLATPSNFLLKLRGDSSCASVLRILAKSLSGTNQKKNGFHQEKRKPTKVLSSSNKAGSIAAATLIPLAAARLTLTSCVSSSSSSSSLRAECCC